MTLKDIVKESSWSEIKKTDFMKTTKQNNLEGFRVTFRKWQLIEPFTSDYIFTLKKDEYDIQNNIDSQPTIYAYHKDNKDKVYGIEGENWGFCLGMEIDKQIIDDYSKEDILAYALWGLTFYGFHDNGFFRKYIIKDSPDVFISHASEDKNSVAKPLAFELGYLGFRVWYDELEFDIGDSLRQKIRNGLSESKLGIVILSKNFFNKTWPEYELNGLLARELNSGKTIIPIWHDVTIKDVSEYDPSLADKLALSTNALSIEQIALKIHDYLHSLPDEE